MPRPICTAAYEAFLQPLRAAWKRARLRQWDVALRLKKSQSYVSKCESGERRIDATEVIAFADLYSVSIEELVRGPLSTEERHRSALRADGGASDSGDAGAAGDI